MGTGAAAAPAGTRSSTLTTLLGRREAELRGSVNVSDTSPHLLVTGPATVLHMNLEPKGGLVTVFRAVRRDGSVADCGSGPRHDGDVVEPTRGVLLVPENESLCATATRPALLSWHARPSTPAAGAPETVHQASLR